MLLSDLVELALLVLETWRRKVRENQLLLCCSGVWPDYSKVRKGSQAGGREGKLTSDGL
jgi:hypothetical protein